MMGDESQAIAGKYPSCEQEMGGSPMPNTMGPEMTGPQSMGPEAMGPNAMGQGQTYVVQAGDSLGMIAQQYGIDDYWLIAANGIANSNVIYVGQTLFIR